MGDSSYISSSTKKLEMPRIASSKKVSKRPIVASSQKIFRRMTLLNNGSKGREYAGHVALFLLKVAALEMFRRFSRAKCPFAWKSLQALQVICYPPFKWIQRWEPLKGLVMVMQKLSKPLFFLSIGTALSDQSEHSEETSDGINDSQESQSSPEPSASPSSGDISISDQPPPNQESESWLLQLHQELEKQGITLPESVGLGSDVRIVVQAFHSDHRIKAAFSTTVVGHWCYSDYTKRINEDELRRFYVAANGNFSSLLSSVKKTIHWRKTYYLLSPHELEVWSKLVFWHGYDVMLRPCLIVRLGLACSSLASLDRPRFTQAIVSQIEHAVQHLVNVEDPRITVLMDCEGLTPLKFPMHMMRFCSTILQDNYPNRLACLFVLRLPPVVRVIAQTFFQVLKPATRQKLRIEGERYNKVLSEYLETIPSFLGGKCTCPKCSTNSNYGPCTRSVEDVNIIEASADFSNGESPSLAGNPYLSDDDLHRTYEQMLRTALISTIMFCVLIAVLVGIIYDPESLRLP